MTEHKHESMLTCESLPREMTRLWGISAYMDLMWMTRDFRSFALYHLSDLLVAVATVTGIFLLSERFNGIGSWSRDQVLFFLGYALMVQSLLATFFGYNFLFISRIVGRGQMDHLLIQPRRLWVTFLTQGFVPAETLGLFLPGIGLMFVSTARLCLPITAVWFFWLAVSLVSSCAIVVAFTYFWGSLAFWSPRAAEEINSSTYRLLDNLKAFPLDGLGRAARGGLLTALPVGFVAWVPCRYLLGIGRHGTAGIASRPVLGIDWQPLLTPGAALLISTVAGWMFRRGLRQYGRVGSSRYLSHGHRR